MATEDVKVEVKYPRWVKRDPSVGDVLCTSAEEEAKLLADWKKNPASHVAQPGRPVHPTDAELKDAREANQEAVDKAHEDRDNESAVANKPLGRGK